MIDPVAENSHIAQVIAEVLTDVANKPRLARASGLSKSTLYAWMNGTQSVPAYGPPKIAAGLMAMGRPKTAIRLLSEIINAHDLGVTVAPLLRPTSGEEIRTAGLKAVADVGRAVDALNRALEDGIITTEELGGILQTHEAAKSAIDAVETAAEVFAGQNGKRLESVG